MQKLIKNNWVRESGEPFIRARILSHEIHPEGLDIDRIRFLEAGNFSPKSGVGHIISVLRGGGIIFVIGDERNPFRVKKGVHLYLPAGTESILDAEPGSELLQVSGASAAQARGTSLLLRDETFVAACASGTQSLRWAFTPQYLSRRIFLHHDQVLLSKSGNPVSWYRTTMFDVAGLPRNEDGEPVFKMSYNSRTECNVCYDVQGSARVRMARHPYQATKQVWDPWVMLDGESTYHLNEAAGCAEEECRIDETTNTPQYLRNKHEVHIADGYVTLCCLFDPAPTGVENHRPGEYSDYEPLSEVLKTGLYETHRREIAKYDEMVDRLSIAKATGTLNALKGTPVWERYEQGRDAQAAIETKLAKTLAADGSGRDRVLARWMQKTTKTKVMIHGGWTGSYAESRNEEPPVKISLDELAIFGGKPAFQEPLHVGRPNLGDRTKLFERINDMLDRKWLSNNGPYVQEFERRVAGLIGVKHCIAMCNGTVALEIAIRALDLKGEVIVPSFTFIATAHALQWQEITPVFCDINPGTHTIDPACVEKMITPRTTGIIGVHLWGRPCDVEALEKIAAARHLKLLFDAAHGFGCSCKGKMIGNFGNAEVYSFHPTKFMNTSEGGAIVTNDDILAKKIRLMKNFGFSGYDNVVYIGTNGKMNELCAVMGVTNLESMDEFVFANQRNYRAYERELAGIPGVSLIAYDHREKCNYQYIILEIDEALSHVTRDQVVEILRSENVLARRYFYPGCHRMEPYRSYFPHAGLVLPETEKLVKRVLSLPNGTAVGPDDIRQICRIMRVAIDNGLEAKEWLSGHRGREVQAVQRVQGQSASAG